MTKITIEEKPYSITWYYSGCIEYEGTSYEFIIVKMHDRNSESWFEEIGWNDGDFKPQEYHELTTKLEEEINKYISENDIWES